MNLKNIVIRIFLFIIILVLSTLPFFLYFDKSLLSPYNGISFYHLGDFFNVWLENNGGAFNFLLVPYDVCVWILSSFISEAKAIQISYAAPLFIALTSSYILSNWISKSRVIGLLGSLVYSYSIYGQYISSQSTLSGSIVFALAPYFVYRILSYRKEQSWFKESVILGTLCVFLIDVNLTFIVYLWALIFSIVLYRGIISGKNVFVNLTKLFLMLSLFYGLTNAVMLFTFISQAFFHFNYLSGSLVAETSDWKSGFAFLHELFRQMGALNFYYENRGIKPYPNMQIFIENIFFVLTSYIYPILTMLFACVLIKQNREKRLLIIFLMTIFIISLFMGMGVFYLSPTKDLYQILLAHVPFFSIFRDSYKIMFVINLIMVIIIVEGTVFIRTKLSKAFIPFIAFMFFVVFLNSFQFWSGTFLKHQLIDIPQSWLNLAATFRKQDKEGRILLVPINPFPVYSFTSLPGKNTTFFRPLLSYKAVYAVIPPLGENPTLKEVYLKYNTANFSKLLGLYGIHWVLLQEDIDWETYSSPNPYAMKQFLDKYLIFNETYK